MEKFLMWKKQWDRKNIFKYTFLHVHNHLPTLLLVTPDILYIRARSRHETSNVTPVIYFGHDNMSSST